MHIVYAVTACSTKAYNELFADVALKPGMQSQKYHTLLIRGIAANAQLDVVANPPVNKSVLNRQFIRLEDENVDGAVFHYIPAIRNPVLKAICVSAGTFFKTARLIRKDSAVVIDCLNRVTGLAALTAARVRGARCVGIVTDLPEMLAGSSVAKKITNYLIQNCTDYVFLTEQMNTKLNPQEKPYVILEGHADISMESRPVSLEQKTQPRICMYAGAISKQFGLNNLLDGFVKAGIPGVQLQLYGYCDFEDELKEICGKHPNISFGGLLLNHEIVEKELQATLLINPRPTCEEFVKYSFPSKNMEYMASGTPLLTSVLPGMPKEYYPYVYLLQDETSDGIAKALKEIFNNSDMELMEKGLAAKEFILKNKNNVVQAAKIIEMLKQ